jgi:uncharacterized protein (DUF305 family)
MKGGHTWQMATIRLAAVVVVLVTAVALTSCGGSSAGGQHARATTAPAGHNPADVAFAQNMIPHHQQAVDMSAMVPSHSANPAMQVIAKEISSDQKAEIHALSVLLQQWGEPAIDHGGHAGMPAMQGMVDPNTMSQLESRNGNAFDELWLGSMVAHHQGAVTMAQDEIGHGQSPDAVGMARNIVTAQQREIAYMTHLLSSAQ